MAKAFSVATNGQIGALARHLARQVRHADA
jgi:hypothetical protein